MFRNKSVQVDHFAMIPRADIPRSSFNIETAHKTTFDAGLLIPIYVDEVLPGDTFSLKMTAFARMATPIFPLMDNLRLSSFFFFVPNRLVWSNWEKFMGEQLNPASSISFVVPQKVGPTGGDSVGSLQDYFGLPTVGQVAAGQFVSYNAMPLRAYNLIWNEWFRDQNLQNSVAVDTGDGPDATTYTLLRRGKRHDYFTSCLPWTQKFTAPTLPLGSSAPVRAGAEHTTAAATAMTFRRAATGALPTAGRALTTGATGQANESASALAGTQDLYPSNLFADLSAAIGGTINALRQSFQIQKLLERDARGGTRYTEIIRSHFGVISPDARLQRPEYLGGGVTPVNINPIAQTSGSGASGTTAPLATLSAFGTVLSNQHGFTQSFTEHGYIIGLVCVDADLTYQQGLRKLWSRSTRYDFYFPVFQALGEQPVRYREIYVRGDSNDNLVFGYQEAWAEYRYHPSRISGLFRSTSAGTIDGWHLAERFTALPLLDSSFIQSFPPMSRVLAVGAAANGQQFIFDSVFQIKATRPMPMYSVPGLIDHF